MTIQLAIEIIGRLHTGVKVAFQHRFAGDSGTILRLDNYAMVNIFDDGRYFVQGPNIDELVIAFGLVEQAWDPERWMEGKEQKENLNRPFPEKNERFDF